MDAGSFVGGLVAGLGGASGIWAAIDQHRMKRAKLQTLRALLEDPDYRYRTLRVLHSAVGGRPTSVADCRSTIDLLNLLHAKGNGLKAGSTDELDQLWSAD